MRVVIDAAIPYIKGILEPYSEVIYLQAKEITATVVRNADALIIRTRTNCNQELLDGSAVKFIATATIGTDHIDQQYCAAHNIEVCSAPGCNARGVLQWVAAALHHIVATDQRSPESYTLGVVGVGNVGSLVSEYARHWGFRVMECDPPRAARESGKFYTIDEIAQKCDIITLHTPLDSTTYHLVNETLIHTMPSKTIIINASRGEVVDNRAVTESGHRYIFDVWESEPHIEPNILQGAMLATPHIAGYSVQGKANATAMAINALAHYFEIPLKEWYPENIQRTTPRPITWSELCATITKYCDIKKESLQLKDSPENFELIRNSYNYREEYF